MRTTYSVRTGFGKSWKSIIPFSRTWKVLENSFFDRWLWKSYGFFSVAHFKPCIRKLCLDKIHELESKCTCMEQDIESLCASADNLAESAEKKGNMLDLTKSNSFRRTAKSKREELEVIDNEIKCMKDNLH